MVLLFPVVGLLSLIWFLIRVIPKPSRAMYPCQRVAFPLAFGFVAWLVGLVGSVVAFERAKSFLKQFAQDLQANDSSKALRLYVLGVDRNERDEKQQWMVSRSKGSKFPGNNNNPGYNL